MNGRLSYRAYLKQNLIAVIGFSLCFYFCYHLIHGQRSYMRLLVLEKKIERTNAQYETARAAREDLERKVVMMRPGSINKDLLEERIQHVLGYVPDGAHVLLDR